MSLQELNSLDITGLEEQLGRCCGSAAWVKKMVALFPVHSEVSLSKVASRVWYGLEEKDWLEAFKHHPRIGDINSIKAKFLSTAAWAAGEQALVKETSEPVIEELLQGNRIYEEKFGFIFIVCATGKTAHEMLQLLTSRINNEPAEEIKIAMKEQDKITHLRLEKLLRS
jgi:2-oxo-4-hydroxy-4-carboxy-5-ureidoimidazoline decarboxylase